MSWGEGQHGGGRRWLGFEDKGTVWRGLLSHSQLCNGSANPVRASGAPPKAVLRKEESRSVTHTLCPHPDCCWCQGELGGAGGPPPCLQTRLVASAELSCPPLAGTRELRFGSTLAGLSWAAHGLRRRICSSVCRCAGGQPLPTCPCPTAAAATAASPAHTGDLEFALLVIQEA